MNIVTLAEIKEFLGLSDTSQDDRIESLIPAFEDFVLDYTKNPFTDPRVCLQTDGISFVSGSPATITDSGEGFVDAFFADGMIIRIDGSFFNDGFYRLNTVEAGTLTLAGNESLTSEAISSGVVRTVARAEIPRPVKLAIARLISGSLSSKSGISAEKIGSYSVNYKDLSKSNGIPEDVLGILHKFKKMY